MALQFSGFPLGVCFTFSQLRGKIARVPFDSILRRASGWDGYRMGKRSMADDEPLGCWG